ncbi:MAG: DUF1501 domain-containing protein [Planctomycetaceae bacterium]|nr:DUF1501 domain-containing protein [Planctomycetaceae bacterium]
MDSLPSCATRRPPLLERRSLLQVGGLSLSGLLSPHVARVEAAVETRSRRKSVIMVYLPGGASHIDMYDMKPDAPNEYRGDFLPIDTNVPGMQVCELMPEHAKIADKFSIIRGIRTHGNHDPTELLTGIHAFASGTIGTVRRPAVGCVVSKVRGVDGPVPPYVSVSSHKLLGSYDDPEESAYLGPTHRPISLTGQLRESLELSADLQTRLNNRRPLFTALSAQQSAWLGANTYTERALEMLSATQIRDALDLSREPESLRRSYGEGVDPRAQGLDFLRARRLVEAGVSFVSIAARFSVAPVGPNMNDPGGWDTHAYNFPLLRKKLPIYDQAVAALIRDLHERGMLDDTLVVIWSEFGRDPKVGNVTPDGRGHWPAAGCALVAGGGLQMGRIVGETDAKASTARFRPYHTQDILATVYHVLGIDPGRAFIDHNGRPQHLLDKGQRIAELV